MGPAYFVIAILGCADGGSSCTPVTTLQTHFQTQEQCSAATGAALIEHSDFDFPTLVASCQRGEVKSARATEHRSRERRPG